MSRPPAGTASDLALGRWEILGLVALVVIIALIPLSLRHPGSDQDRADPLRDDPAFVGTNACRDCHREHFNAWLGSDHDLAMDTAGDSTVLADFDDVEVTHAGVTSRFQRHDGRFFVWTEGPGGEMAEFEITHTFGHDPLQQYLIPFPGGRLQALSLAWDTEREQWFHLNPGERVAPDDWLHWTRNGQNWNGMCAECHSTNLKKNYDPNTRTFATSWSDIDVGCEACHGPGSRHLAWAEIPPLGRPALPQAGLPVPTTDIPADRLVELCAPCHSSRAELSDYDHTGLELLDHMVPSLLVEGQYHPDGQIQGEVYVYGSFLQSKMYARGVSCADCHDSHSLRLHHDGNELCLPCHLPETYDAPDHHFHPMVVDGKRSDGTLCVKCHMMEQPFMVIDWRADHSFRVPRPDLSAEIGTPNACSQIGCHDDRPLAWSIDAYRRWYGQARRPHFGNVIRAARAGETGVESGLERLATSPLHPTIVRATALELLARQPGDVGTKLLENALLADEPLLRQTAATRLNVDDPRKFTELLAPLLADPVKAVRLSALSQLARYSRGLLEPYQQDQFARVLQEYTEAMAYTLDSAPSCFNLGNLFADLGDPRTAERYYRLAIGIDDRLPAVHVNLALLLNAEQRNSEAEQHLRTAVELDPGSTAATYNLGLLLGEMGKYDEAAEFLGRAAAGMPQQARVRSNLGLALQHLGRTEPALAALREAAEISGQQAEYVLVLANMLAQAGQTAEARQWLDRLLARDPGQVEALRMRESLAGP